MSKERRVADNQAFASVKYIKTSVQKLNYVAKTIRKQHVSQALNQLTFSKQRVARDVKQCLLSAIANAENNHNLDIDRLVVERVEVGKAFTMKRFRARARGRGAKILKPFSNLRIILEEKDE